MGTSKNVPSPNSPPWKPVLAILGRIDIPIERQTKEIWRSASAERGPTLVNEFSSPALATACGLASSSTSVQSALGDYDAYLSKDQKFGFATEIGRRALARAVAAKSGSQGFAGELFAEATSYYASRDLPSFIGSRGRLQTTSAAISFKATMKEQTKSVVASSGAMTPSPENWVGFVERVVAGLRGSR